jgi:hypothetical protein
MAIQMRERFNKKNILEERLNQLNRKNKLVWKKYDAQFCIFPSLTEDDVRNISFGNVQFQFMKH